MKRNLIGMALFVIFLIVVAQFTNESPIMIEENFAEEDDEKQSELTSLFDIYGSTHPAIGDDYSVDDYLIYDHRYDNMDRGDHDYYGPLLVEQFDEPEDFIQRGNVILFQLEIEVDLPRYTGVSRIIALPGETLQIKHGQIYIDDQELQGSYGNARRLGYTIDDMQRILENAHLELHAEKDLTLSIQEINEMEVYSFRLPDGFVYVIGDDWLRSRDTRNMGPIPIQMIEGVIVGRVLNP